MADQYEIREDPSNPYWSFVVWNLTENWKVDRFPTREKAQECIDKQSKVVEFDDNLLAALDRYEGKPPSQPEKPENPDEIAINAQKPVGAIIEFEGESWLVTSCTYISQKDAAELEEGWDAYVQPGWDTTLRKVHPGDKTLLTLAELVQSGEARFVNAHAVKFVDEESPVEISDLAYNDQIGLYQKSKFPTLQG